MTVNVRILQNQLELDGVSMLLEPDQWRDPSVVSILRNDVDPSRVMFVFTYHAVRATLTHADALRCSQQLGVTLR